MSQEEGLVWSTHKTDTYHLSDSCDRCPERATGMRMPVAETWDSLDLCSLCSERTVWRSKTDDLYHTDESCSWNRDTSRMSLETAVKWGFSECEYCDTDSDAGRGYMPVCDECGGKQTVLSRDGRSLCVGCCDDRMIDGDSE
jgi:hypothetical protein